MGKLTLPPPSHRLEFPNRRGQYAFIYVDGEPLPVHDIDESASTKHTGTVKMAEGTDYQVYIIDTCTQPYSLSYESRYSLDGKPPFSLISSKASRTHLLPKNHPERFQCPRTKNGSPIYFSYSTTADDEAAGTSVEIAIHRIKVIGNSIGRRVWKDQDAPHSSVEFNIQPLDEQPGDDAARHEASPELVGPPVVPVKRARSVTFEKTDSDLELDARELRAEIKLVKVEREQKKRTAPRPSKTKSKAKNRVKQEVVKVIEDEDGILEIVSSDEDDD